MFSKILQKAARLRLESFYKGRVLTFMGILCLCLPYLAVQTENCHAAYESYAHFTNYDWLSGALGNAAQGFHDGQRQVKNALPLMGDLYTGGMWYGPDTYNTAVQAINSPVVAVGSGFMFDSPMASLIKQLEAKCNSGGCGMESILNGGGGNQFFGQKPYPNSWDSSFQGQGYDPYNAGPGISVQNPIFGATLGFDPYSSYNVGTQFLKSFNNMFSPPSSLNSGFYGSGYLARNGPQSVNGNMLGLQVEDTLAYRYSAIDKMQLDFYYTDPDLTSLRIEANYNYMYYLYTDPWYLYHSYQQNFNSNTVSTTRPIYPYLANLSQEIASWTSPPNNIQTLKDRFNKRLLLTYYNAELSYETQNYFSLYPDQQTYLLYTKSTIDQIIQKNWGSAAVTTWAEDWNNRFQSIHENSEAFASVQEEMAELLDDFPAFEEYLSLNNDVISLIPDLTDYASVKQTQDKLNDVLSDPDTSQLITNYYNTYKNQVSALLETTDVKAEMERFYEQINGLLNADPTYNLLKFTQYLQILALEDYRKKVHDLVYNCQLIYGTWCDPYSNLDVLNLIYSQDTYDLIYNSALFYEMYNYFWYTFYNSTQYLNLEADAAEKIQTALDPVLQQLTSIQEQYVKNVNSIPKLKTYQEAMVNMMSDLRSKSPELDQDLNRMEQLAEDLYYNPTPPTVASTGPANGTTNVAVGSNITATFSEEMNRNTITKSTFTLNNGVTGTVSYNSSTKTATCNPSTDLNYSATYTAKITTGVRDNAGNAMTSNYTWSFTTAPPPDTTPPTVTSTSPANGASNVAVSSNITATFSEAMNAATITTSTFKLNNGVTGMVSYNSTTRTATFDPSTNLNYSTTYTATITTGVKDSAGNAMVSNYTWSFTTAPMPDTTPPTVTSTSPANGATNIAVGSDITAIFSEAMNATTITTSTFKLNNGVTGTVSYNSATRTATFDPSTNLNYSTTYTATITTGVKDSTGNAMVSNYTWSFTTTAATSAQQAFYTFDEGSGTTAGDSSGGNNHGVVMGAAWTAGRNGSGLSFDGVDDCVDLGNPSSLQPSTVSLSAWFKTTISGKMILRKRMYGYGLEVTSSGKIAFWICNASATKFMATSTNAYNDNAWHHAVGVYDGSAVKLYIDGSPVATARAETIYYGTGGIAVGRDGDFSGSYFKGLVDEVRIYGKTLNDQEVLDLYTMYPPIPTPTPNPTPTPPSNLQAYYPFNEGSGTIAGDSSGNGNNGAVNGATWATGKNGSGLTFNGVNSYVDVGNPSNLQPGKVSLSAWFKTTAASGMIMRKRGYGYGLEVVSSGKISFWIYNAAATKFMVTSISAYNDDQWHHAVGVYDGSSVKLFIDGSQAATASAGTIYYGAGGVAIGRDGNFSGSYFNGIIDEVRVYNNALSTQDVLDLYNQFTPGPVSHWKFDEGSGTVVSDSSGSGNNGAVNGATWATGKNGSGLTFNGVNSYVDLGNPSTLQPGKVSLSAWFKTTAASGMIMRKRGYGYGLEVVSSGKISFWIYNAAATKFMVTSISAYNDNTWHHAVGVYDGSTVKLYIDGSTVATANAGTIYYGAGGIAIGRDGNFGGSYFNGSIDDVSIYNLALNDQEIQGIYNAIAGTIAVASLDALTGNRNIDDTHITPETGITLKSFRAEAGRDGNVILHWEISSETDTAGFNLYRSRRKSGRYTKVNNVLINVKGSDQSGAQYRFSDEPDSGKSYYYKLESVDYYGEGVMHSPIRVRMKFPGNE